MFRRIFSILSYLFLGALSWDCGSSTAPTPRDVVGTYHIVSVNSKALPVVLSDSLTIISSEMELSASDSYKETITYERHGTRYATEYRGIFTTDGRLVIIQFEDGGSFNLNVADKRTLVENDSNGIIVYIKQ